MRALPMTFSNIVNDAQITVSLQALKKNHDVRVIVATLDHVFLNGKELKLVLLKWD